VDIPRGGDAAPLRACTVSGTERFGAWARRLADERLAEVSTYFAKRSEIMLLPERVRLVSWCQ
jgi:hypothetical protein